MTYLKSVNVHCISNFPLPLSYCQCEPSILLLESLFLH